MYVHEEETSTLIRDDTIQFGGPYYLMRRGTGLLLAEKQQYEERGEMPYKLERKEKADRGWHSEPTARHGLPTRKNRQEEGEGWPVEVGIRSQQQEKLRRKEKACRVDIRSQQQ